LSHTLEAEGAKPPWKEGNWRWGQLKEPHVSQELDSQSAPRRPLALSDGETEHRQDSFPAVNSSESEPSSSVW
jgi:hypothetical protein